MANTYAATMNRLENDYNSAISKADEAYRLNNFNHSMEECKYLQEALNYRAKMVEMSRGEEKLWQKRKADELYSRLKTTILIVDPEYFTKKGLSADGSAKQQSNKENGTAKKSSTVSLEATEEELREWCKDSVPDVSFDKDVYGMEEVKARLRSCVKNASLERAKRFLKMSVQKSYILYGPPGCGKTHITKAFVHELTQGQSNVTFISVESANILRSLLGETEIMVKKIFNTAIKMAPSVLFVDELDGVCKDRSKAGIPEYASSLTTAFLTGYNSLKESGKQIIFIGATNYIDNVDMAMRNRLEQIYIPFPDREARMNKFERELRTDDGCQIALLGGMSYELMADMTAEQVADKAYIAWDYRDIEHLCDNLRQLLLDAGMEKYSDEETLINAMKTCAFGITPELFKKAMGAITVDDKSDYVYRKKTADELTTTEETPASSAEE